MTRECLYVATTRGGEANTAYVAVDQFPLEEHQKAPEPDMTARSVLAGILAHETAERSAHETLRAEHENLSFRVGERGPHLALVTVWTDEDGDRRSSIKDESETTG